MGVLRDMWEKKIDKLDLLETAWNIIANSNEGNWDKETDEWKKAAERWRDEYFKFIKR